MEIATKYIKIRQLKTPVKGIFANCKEGSYHKRVTIFHGSSEVWIMGIGEFVRLLPGEFSFVTESEYLEKTAK